MHRWHIFALLATAYLVYIAAIFTRIFSVHHLRKAGTMAMNFSSTTSSEQHPLPWSTLLDDHSKLPYLLFKPPMWSASSSKKWPLLVRWWSVLIDMVQ